MLCVCGLSVPDGLVVHLHPCGDQIPPHRRDLLVSEHK